MKDVASTLTVALAMVLLLSGGIELSFRDERSLSGVVVITAGLILLGSWLTLEILYQKSRRGDSEDGED